MNKKIYQISALGYQEVNYANIFKTKLKILNYHPLQFKRTQEECIYNQDGITIIGGYDSSNIYYANEIQDAICILLSSDSNSNGCTQWFNFKVKVDQEINTNIKFRIVNNRRSKCLATIRNIYTSSGECVNIYYYKTNISHPFYRSLDKEIAQYQQKIAFYTLEFSYNFKNKDFIQFAYAEPYPVSRYLKLQQYNHRVIGKSWLKFPLIEISLGKSDQIVVILARQHPSETVGSFICENIIKIIANSNPKYRYLIYPMVNPDGVYLGNSRCNYFGQDLNRKWLYPSQTEPELVNLKKELESRKSQILFMIDLHGHSQKLNYFIYACVQNLNYLNIRHFIHPLQSHKLFSIQDCSYRIKYTTARQTFYNQFHIKHSMTVETSLFGTNDRRFNQNDYEEIAMNIFNAIETYNEENKLKPFVQSNDAGDSDSEGEEDIIKQEKEDEEQPLKTIPSPKKQQKKYYLPKLNLSQHSCSNRKHSCTEMECQQPYFRDGESRDDSNSPIKAFPKRMLIPKRMGSLRPKYSSSFTIQMEQIHLLKSIGKINNLI